MSDIDVGIVKAVAQGIFDAFANVDGKDCDIAALVMGRLILNGEWDAGAIARAAIAAYEEAKAEVTTIISPTTRKA